MITTQELDELSEIPLKAIANRKTRTDLYPETILRLINEIRHLQEDNPALWIRAKRAEKEWDTMKITLRKFIGVLVAADILKHMPQLEKPFLELTDCLGEAQE